MTTSNSKFRTGSKEAPTEPFKRAVTSCLRAIAKAPELEVTFAAERPGLAPGKAKAFQTASPDRYSPADHVVSWPVRSRVSISGGWTKSSTSAVSPAFTTQGNSPSTCTVSALAAWKWR